MRGRDRVDPDERRSIAAHGSNADEFVAPATGRQISIDTNEGTWLSPDIFAGRRHDRVRVARRSVTVDTRGGSAHALTTGMAFDSQPVFSPDGHDIAFRSDRSGAENAWIHRGRRLESPANDDARRQFGLLPRPHGARTAKSIFVSHYRVEFNGFELWQVDAASGATSLLIPMKKDSDTPRERLSERAGCIPVGRRKIPLLRAPHR